MDKVSHRVGFAPEKLTHQKREKKYLSCNISIGAINIFGFWLSIVVKPFSQILSQLIM